MPTFRFTCLVVSAVFLGRAISPMRACAQVAAPAGAPPAAAAGAAAGGAAPGAPAGAPPPAAGGQAPANAPANDKLKARVRGTASGAVSSSPMTPIAPSVKGGAVMRTSTDIRTGQQAQGPTQGPVQQFNIQPLPGIHPNAVSPRAFNVQGYGGNINPGNPLVLGDMPLLNSIPPAMTQPQPYYGPSFAAPSSSVGGMIASCLQGLSGSLGGYAQMAALQSIVDQADEKMGFQPYPGISPETRSRHPKYYPSVVRGLNGQQAGCQQFINDKMEIGHWGRVALEEMKSHDDIYKEKIPADIGRYCANFRTMDEDTRLRFWLWFFASLASPESSCNPGAVGRGPNGNAIGLFQLEPRACARVNMYVSESDLQRAEVNIRCAVRLFAEELRKRPTIMIGTSRGELGTYWGPLRNDNHNLARGGDISAHFKAEARLKQNPECEK